MCNNMIFLYEYYHPSILFWVLLYHIAENAFLKAFLWLNLVDSVVRSPYVSGTRKLHYSTFRVLNIDLLEVG